MCGIAGFALDGDGNRGISPALMRRLASRGPDASFAAQIGNFGLVQTRLAVVDLNPTVKYPMGNEAGNIWLLFNGEIYNHLSLRHRLEACGHTFNSACDAEVVVHGYEEWGIDVFPRLNGMFALAIVDQRTSDIILARDAAGIKPLVRTTGSRFSFSSDALSLVDAGLSRGEPDTQALEKFLSLLYIPPPDTGIRDIKQVLPGTALIRSQDGSEVVREWAPPAFDLHQNPRQRIPLQELNNSVRDAVRLELEADVDVGIFLSGGLDSTLIAATAVDLGAAPETFTISFSGHGDYDESLAARQTAKVLGLQHHVEALDIGFREAVEMVGSAFDQPFADSSAIPMLALSRLARSHVKVALSGTGGDDLFAGYYRHRAHILRPLISCLPGQARSFLAGYRPQPGSERATSTRLFRSYLARLAASAANDDLSQYHGLISRQTSTAGLACIKSSMGRLSAEDPLTCLIPLSLPRGASTLRALQDIEFHTYLPGDLLTKEDRSSMAFGLEARVPLLSRELISVANRMPDSQKISLFQGKRALTELLGKEFPQLTRRRSKRGFAVPLSDLFSGPWEQEATEWFREANSDLADGRQISSSMTGETLDGASAWTLATLIEWEKQLAGSRKRGQQIGSR